MVTRGEVALIQIKRNRSVKDVINAIMAGASHGGCMWF
jgi:hypothetical protein